jgi:hypothetical protein
MLLQLRRQALSQQELCDEPFQNEGLLCLPPAAMPAVEHWEVVQ